MAINFPSGATTGQIHTTSTGTQYTFDGDKWIVAGSKESFTSLNDFTSSYYTDSSSFESIIGQLVSATSSYLTSETDSQTLSITGDQLSISNGNTITIPTGSELPTGIISGSAQITDFGFVSGTYETTGRGILSGSISYTSLTDIPSGIVSGSSQITITESQISDLTHTDISALNAFTSSYNTDSASFDSRISSFASSGVPAGTVSGSAQLEGLFETTGRGILSGSIVSVLPTGVISGSSQIIITESQISDLTHTDISYLNSYTSSTDNRLNLIESATSSYETMGRGIISESVVTISDTQPTTGVGNLWYDSNGGNLYLHYDTNTWVDTSNGVIQTIINDGSLLSTASFNSWTASYTASSTPLPDCVVSGSAQITSFGFVSGTYETTGRGILSGSISYTSLTDIPSGIVSQSTDLSSLNAFTSSYFVTSASFDTRIITEKGRVDAILAASSADKDSFAEIVSLINSVDLTNDTAFASYYTSSNARLTSLESVTGSFETTGRGIISSSLQISGLGYSTTSSLNTVSSSVSTVQTQLNSVTASLGSTSNAFSYTSVVNPTGYVLVSYPTASYNGGVIDILLVNTGNSTATSAAYQFASFGANAGISQNGKQTSAAGAPSPAMSIAVSNGNMQIKVTETGTFNIKGVARLF